MESYVSRVVLDLLWAVLQEKILPLAGLMFCKDWRTKMHLPACMILGSVSL